jgi:glycerol-3-phosphate dehydrogenase
MKRKFEGLDRENFDVIVIGGGVIGTGIARDAALRGLKTLLLEKEDFAYGTTSRSSRLIHGGLRYLRHLDFQVVRQDMREREILLRIAPHLVRPLNFLIPITRISERVFMGVGMRLYDLLSFDKSLQSYHYLSRGETLRLEPRLELANLVGSYMYSDCQILFPERLCLENALSAAEHGALIMNHTQVIGVTKIGGAVAKVQVKDRLSGDTLELAGRVVVNVAGSWANDILNMLLDHSKHKVRVTKGIHLVTPKISSNAVVLFARTDGRLLFVIPWQDYSLVGTTDIDYSGDLDEVYADADDVDYLLAEVNHAFPRIQTGDVFYTIAGLRSLVAARGRPSDISRAYKLIDHEHSDGVSGFISVLGGKMTSYRLISQGAVDLVCRKLSLKARCTASESPLPGAFSNPRETLEKVAGETGLTPEMAAHLNALYGSRSGQILDLVRTDPRGKQVICPHTKDIVAEVWHSVNEESALTVTDFLLRRSMAGLAPCKGLDAVETVASEMGRLLRWNTSEQKRQVESYRSIVALGQQFREQGMLITHTTTV